jgi:hypothetical protein
VPKSGAYESSAYEDAQRVADALEEGSIDPDEVEYEPAWWDDGSDDETCAVGRSQADAAREGIGRR